MGLDLRCGLTVEVISGVSYPAYLDLELKFPNGCTYSGTYQTNGSYYSNDEPHPLDIIGGLENAQIITR